MTKEIVVRVELNKELTQQFEAIKKYYGFESNTDAVRFLITEKLREIEERKHELEERIRAHKRIEPKD